ncbi:uncharacterized protein BDW70DRAFT_129686 [Aspergillus foveolatus]|uniref:uncharacterized protein n=1 Tax=Aspergillus foveolatus TaxID=210207 RepID=UPI003CCE44F8
MLLCLLSVSALLLRGLAVSAENIDFQPHPVPPFPANGSYTANLESSKCAFSPGDCINGSGYSSTLTIRFTLSNGSLLANNVSIFPPSLPTQFQAERHWALESRPGSGSEIVTVAYKTDAQSIPPSQRLNTIPDRGRSKFYRLKLSLFDLQGRPATTRPVSVGLVRTQARPGNESGIEVETGSGSGTLQVVQIEETVHRVYHHHLHTTQNRNPDGTWSWWRMKSWKSYFISHNREVSMAEAAAEAETAPPPLPHPDTTSGMTGKSKGLTTWIGNRHSWHLSKLVLIPGFLELAIAVLCSVVGYLLGIAIVAVYEYFFESDAACSKRPDLERPLGNDVLFDSDTEKRRLMTMSSDSSESEAYI